MRRKIGFIMNVFCMVTTCVVISVAFSVSVVNPSDMIPVEILWQIPAVSMLTAMMSLIYPWDRGMGKAEVIIRVLIHYLLTCGIVLYAGWQFDWYDIHRAESIVEMIGMITIIFVVVSGIAWARSQRTARQMNEKLQEYQNREGKEKL